MYKNIYRIKFNILFMNTCLFCIKNFGSMKEDMIYYDSFDYLFLNELNDRPRSFEYSIVFIFSI